MKSIFSNQSCEKLCVSLKEKFNLTVCWKISRMIQNYPKLTEWLNAFCFNNSILHVSGIPREGKRQPVTFIFIESKLSEGWFKIGKFISIVVALAMLSTWSYERLFSIRKVCEVRLFAEKFENEEKFLGFGRKKLLYISSAPWLIHFWSLKFWSRREKRHTGEYMSIMFLSWFFVYLLFILYRFLYLTMTTCTSVPTWITYLLICEQ